MSKTLFCTNNMAVGSEMEDYSQLLARVAIPDIYALAWQFQY